jgi:hypothetical protein
LFAAASASRSCTFAAVGRTKYRASTSGRGSRGAVMSRCSVTPRERRPATERRGLITSRQASSYISTFQVKDEGVEEDAEAGGKEEAALEADLAAAGLYVSIEDTALSCRALSVC